MYFPDLSPYTYATQRPLADVLNVGWLDKSSPFQKGPVPALALDRLYDWFRIARVNQMRGIHECNLCRAEQWPPLPLNDNPNIDAGGKKLFLGNWEIWIPGNEGRIFASPALIIHYVKAHEYFPPQEFIEAAMSKELKPGWHAEAEFSRRTML
jgi:hypothetical protein